MKLQKILPLLLIGLMISCASYYSEMRNIRRNPKEILEFKKYLENQYDIADFKNDLTIWTLETQDTVISKFGSEHSIFSISQLGKYEGGHYYNQKGNIVTLSFKKKPFIEKHQNIIFDYTEKGLKIYNPELAKFEIAERIYIFR